MEQLVYVERLTSVIRRQARHQQCRAFNLPLLVNLTDSLVFAIADIRR